MATRKSELASLPVLPGWVTMVQAAKILGMTLPGVHWRINNGDFKWVFRVGGEDGERMTVLINENEVLEFDKNRERRAGERAVDLAFRRQLREWNRRVKAWAAEHMPDAGALYQSGPPTKAVRAAFEEANPDDPRPVKPKADA